MLSNFKYSWLVLGFVMTLAGNAEGQNYYQAGILPAMRCGLCKGEIEESDEENGM